MYKSTVWYFDSFYVQAICLNLQTICDNILRLHCYLQWPLCVQELYESFIRCKTKIMLWKEQKVSKGVPKKCTPRKSCLPMKRFSIPRKNSISKMTTYLPKLNTRSKMKSQGFGRGSALHISNGLEGNFILQCNPDSFLRCWCKNEWWSPPSHVKRCLATSEDLFLKYDNALEWENSF